MTWEVRERRDSELHESVALLAQVHVEHRYPIGWPEDPASWLTPTNLAAAWVVTRHDEVLGHACLVRNDPATHDLRLERLFVSPDAAGNGAGRALLGQATSWAAHRGFRLTLDVAENCSRAIALYARLGWRMTGRTAIEWGDEVADSVLHFEAPAPRMPSGPA